MASPYSVIKWILYDTPHGKEDWEEVEKFDLVDVAETGDLGVLHGIGDNGRET